MGMMALTHEMNPVGYLSLGVLFGRGGCPVTLARSQVPALTSRIACPPQTDLHATGPPHCKSTSAPNFNFNLFPSLHLDCIMAAYPQQPETDRLATAKPCKVTQHAHAHTPAKGHTEPRNAEPGIEHLLCRRPPPPPPSRLVTNDLLLGGCRRCTQRPQHTQSLDIRVSGRPAPSLIARGHSGCRAKT